MGKLNYIAICYQAGKSELPLTFKTDITTHDRLACDRNPDTRRFIWALGATGTNMIWLDPCDVRFSTVSARSLIECFLQNDRASLFFWDGSRLGEITADQAVQILTARDTDVVLPKRCYCNMVGCTGCGGNW